MWTCTVALICITMYGDFFIVHALWTKIQLTMDKTVASRGAFLPCVFSQELQVEAWPPLSKVARSSFSSWT
jgi:hypothetical protein